MTYRRYNDLLLLRNAGYPDDPAMHGLIAGLWSSLSGLGRFVSRVGSGILVDFIGFNYTAAIVTVLQVIVVSIYFSKSADFLINHSYGFPTDFWVFSFWCFWEGSEKKQGLNFDDFRCCVKKDWNFDFISLDSHLYLCLLSNSEPSQEKPNRNQNTL